MKDLLKAITTIYEDSQHLMAVTPSGLHYALAPRGAKLPYIAFHHIGSTTDYSTTDVRYEDLIQFSIFARSVEKTLEIYELLVTAYSYATLSYEDGQQLVCRLESRQAPVLQEDVWMVTADFMILRAEAILN